MVQDSLVIELDAAVAALMNARNVAIDQKDSDLRVMLTDMIGRIDAHYPDCKE